MLTYDYTKDLLNLQGVEVIKIEKSESKTLIYTQLPVKPHTCPCCSHQTTSVHDYRIRKIKDIFAFGRYCPTGAEKKNAVTPLQYRDFLDTMWKKYQKYKSDGVKTYFNLKDHLWTLRIVE